MSGARKLSPKQRQVMLWWQKNYDAIICDGAVRSGKTFCMGVAFLLWAMTCFHGRQFALCGKTIGALRRNLLYDALPEVERVGVRCEERRSENSFTLRWGGRSNRFLLFGGQDEGSAALIQGVTLAGLLLDEAALMPRSFVEQACARCSVPGSKLWFNCNPEGPEHWFYREWILKAEERRALYLHFTMEDNPGLDEAVRERYQRLYSGIFYRRFVLGEWVTAEGRVYDFFDRRRDAAPVPPGRMEAWRVSVDYGTVNPTSMGLWGRRNGVWYRVKEFYYDSRREGRQKTDAEYVRDLRTLCGGKRVERVIVDPSAASFLAALRQAGFPVKAADNRVLDGIRVTAGMLREGKIILCEPCEDCLREMGLYCWESGKEVPRKENDHAMDDLRYFAMDLQGETRRFAATYVERRA
nr:MAG TPA: large terminase [Caudoviricetes sp.]